MALALIQMINTVLSIWLNEQRFKYIDENKTLEEKYHAEINKPIPPDEATYNSNRRGFRSNAVLDDLEFQLRNLSTALSASIAESNAGNKSAGG